MGRCEFGIQAKCTCRGGPRTGATEKIRAFLRDEERRPRSVRHISEATGIAKEKVTQHASYLVGIGQLKRLKRGWYIWKEYAWE